MHAAMGAAAAMASGPPPVGVVTHEVYSWRYNLRAVNIYS